MRYNPGKGANFDTHPGQSAEIYSERESGGATMRSPGKCAGQTGIGFRRSTFYARARFSAVINARKYETPPGGRKRLNLAISFAG